MSKILVKLKQKRDQIEMRIQQAEARKKQKERKRETQRKILVGTYYLFHAQQQGRYQELIQQIDSFLTRNSDRKLFDLPTLSS